MDEISLMAIGLITIIVICYILYKLQKPKYYDDLIKKKKEEITILDSEINTKKEILKNINDHEIFKINTKIDMLLNKNNSSDYSPLIILLLIIATGIILYFTYKWTYYIQPETINKIINQTGEQITNQIGNLFQ